MPVRQAQAQWNGSLKEGAGTVSTHSGAVDVGYSFSTRFEDKPGTNPEELIAAAHAACYSMALSAGLSRAGFTPERVATTAKVHLDKVDEGFKITRIHLSTVARVPGLDERAFMEHADKAKNGCPVSRALAATLIELDARLEA